MEENRLTIGEKAPKKGCWWYTCSCGTKKILPRWHVNANVIRSCGCLQKELTIKRLAKHGMCRSSEYRAWSCMLSRCLRKTHKHYSSYGGRGITVCVQWVGKDGFVSFLADMGRKPTPKHTIERIDNDGNYEPGNCRWATRAEQSRNTRQNRNVTWKGETKCISAWARELGMSRTAFMSRLSSKNFTLDEVFTTPVGSVQGPKRKPC